MSKVWPLHLFETLSTVCLQKYTNVNISQRILLQQREQQQRSEAQTAVVIPKQSSSGVSLPTVHRM